MSEWPELDAFLRGQLLGQMLVVEPGVAAAGER